jgi:hypothetical protein
MARPQIEAVTAANLDEFCGFLAENLNSAMAPAQFRQGLTRAWHVEPPNHGFLVRAEGRIVGGIGAIYAQRPVQGRPERFCNITGWCVLESHRAQSMRLAMAVIAQPGWHFTDFSPTKVVGSMLSFLKFQPMDERRAVLPNLPWLSLGGFRVLDESADIERELTRDGGDALQAWLDHQDLPWLRFALVGRPSQWCLIVYKRGRFKGLPAANVLHVGDSRAFTAGWRVLGAHLLARGMVSTHVDLRLIGSAPSPARIRSGFNAKMVLSGTLSAAEIDVLYSESVAMDL